jgi:hypothetical protein
MPLDLSSATSRGFEFPALGRSISFVPPAAGKDSYDIFRLFLKTKNMPAPIGPAQLIESIPESRMAKKDRQKQGGFLPI